MFLAISTFTNYISWRKRFVKTMTVKCLTSGNNASVDIYALSTIMIVAVTTLLILSNLFSKEKSTERRLSIK